MKIIAAQFIAFTITLSLSLGFILPSDTMPVALQYSYNHRISSIFARGSNNEDCGHIHYFKNSDANTGWINQLDVPDCFQHRGIVTRLFQAAIEDLRAQGCSRIEWNATHSSVGFYLKNNAQYAAPENARFWIGKNPAPEFFSMYIQLT